MTIECDCKMLMEDNEAQVIQLNAKRNEIVELKEKVGRQEMEIEMLIGLFRAAERGRDAALALLHKDDVEEVEPKKESWCER